MRARNFSKFSIEPNNILQLPPGVSELALVPEAFWALKGRFLSPVLQGVSTRREKGAHFPAGDDWKLTLKLQLL